MEELSLLNNVVRTLHASAELQYNLVDAPHSESSVYSSDDDLWIDPELYDDELDSFD